ncbi:hypothetical protein P3T76_002128 [Phytophthora citrophthora]|uniref:RxLR effector protein n=1 Tax=Phytophthora citrophthora TaxID=4793 RepID=A0AAD9GZ28_9STRA|nr:hypothetical protein P3T76_002128 [Phytophthora citrophthora]
MRFSYVTLLAATATLASFADVSGATDLDHTQVAKVTSVDAALPINTNRFLRRRKDYEAINEERGFETLAAQLDSSVLPAIRKVATMDLGRASLTLQQLRIPFDKRLAIQQLLQLSKADRKAVLLLIK